MTKQSATRLDESSVLHAIKLSLERMLLKTHRQEKEIHTT